MDNTEIGGAAAASAGNVIAGNAGKGIGIKHISDGSGQDWSGGLIKNNYLGYADDGVTPLDNDDNSIYVDSTITQLITGFVVGDPAAKNLINNLVSDGLVLVNVTLDNFDTAVTTDNTCATTVDGDPVCVLNQETGSGGGSNTPSSGGGSGGGLIVVVPTSPAPSETTEPSEEPADGEEIDKEVPTEEPDTTPVVDDPVVVIDQPQEPAETPEDSTDVSLTIQPQVNPVSPVRQPVGPTPVNRPNVGVLNITPEQIDNAIAQYESVGPQQFEDRTLIEQVITERFLIDENVSEITPEVESLVTEAINQQLTANENQSLNVYLGEGVYQEVTPADNIQVVFTVGLTEQQIADLRAQASRSGNLLLLVDQATDYDRDGVADLLQLAAGLDLFNDDLDGDGFSNSDEFFFGFDLNQFDQYDGQFRVTNLDGYTVGSNPSIRIMGDPGETYDVFFVRDADQEIFQIGSVEIDEEYKGEIMPEEALPDGVYYLSMVNEEGELGKLSKMTVDEIADEIKPDLSDVRVVNDELVAVDGQTDPGLMIFSTFKSVILSSVALSDSNGQFMTEHEPNHELVVYAMDRERRYISSGVRLFLASQGN